jgi:hypothetical protein
MDVLFVRHRPSVARPIKRTRENLPGRVRWDRPPATVSAAREPGQLRQLRLPIGTANTSRLLVGRIPPGGSREPVGEGAAADLVLTSPRVALPAVRNRVLGCSNYMVDQVELSGLEPLTSCMP